MPRSLFVATVLDVTAVGLVVPILSSYSRALGGGPRFTGLLQATYGLTQLVGANALGGLSDSRGRVREKRPAARPAAPAPPPERRAL